LIIALNFHPKGWSIYHLCSSENANVPSLLKAGVMPIGPFEVKKINIQNLVEALEATFKKRGYTTNAYKLV
jgi:hypothetical protein